jgi:elongation factor G
MTDGSNDSAHPLIFVTIDAAVETDRPRLGKSLAAMASRDPSLHVGSDPDTGLTTLHASSEDQIVRVVGRLLTEFGLSVTAGQPQVAYLETIRQTAEREIKFVRRDERAHYAHVVVRVEPLPRGRGVEIAGGPARHLLADEYVAAVELGIREASEGGVLAGYPLVDVRATLLSGSSHPVDSSVLAFKIAASMALKDAARQASPVLLEPLMEVEVVTPDELIGEIIGDLSIRRGQIQGVESRGEGQAITAKVPLDRMLGYAGYLRTATAGRATYSMKLFAWVERLGPPDPDGDEPVSKAMRVA